MHCEKPLGCWSCPGTRYTSREFFDLEMERLWPHVWQAACREEEIPNTGDFLEYTIGDQSILVVRSEDDDIRAFFNCLSASRHSTGFGRGHLRRIPDPLSLPRVALELQGDISEVVDRHDFPPTMTDDLLCLGEVPVGRWGGFVFVNMDPDCEPFDSFLGTIPERFATYRFQNLRFRSYRTILLRVQLEGGGRRLQRELPPAGPTPTDADLVQRHPVHLRAARPTQLLLRARGAPSARPGRALASASSERTSTRRRCSPRGSTPSPVSSRARIKQSSRT